MATENVGPRKYREGHLRLLYRGHQISPGTSLPREGIEGWQGYVICAVLPLDFFLPLPFLTNCSCPLFELPSYRSPCARNKHQSTGQRGRLGSVRKSVICCWLSVCTEWTGKGVRKGRKDTSSVTLTAAWRHTPDGITEISWGLVRGLERRGQSPEAS